MRKKVFYFLGSAVFIFLIILLSWLVFLSFDKNKYPIHRDITATVFWVGEDLNKENNIKNTQSAWDSKWQDHFGGVDNPKERNGYYPKNFIPKENPFYFALPYNDFDQNGKRKNNVDNFVYWAKEKKEWRKNESMCKNRWIKITKGRKSVYAQWESVGPFSDDDVDYVFGTKLPKNKLNQAVGINVSPAVRDCLSLSEIDKVTWQFVDEKYVPDGPWKEIITERQLYWD